MTIPRKTLPKTVSQNLDREKPMSRKSRSHGLVYSTAPAPPEPERRESERDIKISSKPGEAVMRIEKRGHGGKRVTVIELRETGMESASELGKGLRSHCGTGGTERGTSIELQGDQRGKAGAFLEKLGWRVRGKE